MPSGRAPRPSVLRTPALGALAAAEVVSSLGSRMTYLALPWFVLEGGNQLTALVGPAAAGVLIAWIGVTNVVYVDAATYLVSFALVKLCVPERPPFPTSEASGVLAGLRHLLGDRLLGPLLATALVANLAGPALTASLSALAFEQYGRSSRVAGLFFAAIGGGALLGVGAAMGLLRAVAPIRLAAAAFALGALSLWALPFALPAAALAVALAWFGAATPLVNAPLLGLVTARTPEALRAKVMLAVITVAMLAGPLGALAAGPLIETAGVRFVLALVAGVMTLASVAFAAIAWARGEAGVAEPRPSVVRTP